MKQADFARHQPILEMRRRQRVGIGESEALPYGSITWQERQNSVDLAFSRWAAAARPVIVSGRTKKGDESESLAAVGRGEGGLVGDHENRDGGQQGQDRDRECEQVHHILLGGRLLLLEPVEHGFEVGFAAFEFLLVLFAVELALQAEEQAERGGIFGSEARKIRPLQLLDLGRWRRCWRR